MRVRRESCTAWAVIHLCIFGSNPLFERDSDLVSSCQKPLTFAADNMVDGRDYVRDQQKPIFQAITPAAGQ